MPYKELCIYALSENWMAIRYESPIWRASALISLIDVKLEMLNNFKSVIGTYIRLYIVKVIVRYLNIPIIGKAITL